MSRVVLAILLPTTLGLACAFVGGRPHRGDGAIKPAPADPALNQSAAQEGLVNAIAQLKSEIKLLIEVRANLAGQIGAGNTSNQVGGNQILDSKVALCSVAGLVILSLGLALIYRRSAQRNNGVSAWLIRQLEARRTREPCDCGQCADCIIESLRKSNHPLARVLHKAVKTETG